MLLYGNAFRNCQRSCSLYDRPQTLQTLNTLTCMNDLDLWPFWIDCFACCLIFLQVLQSRTFIRSNKLLGSFKLDVGTVYAATGNRRSRHFVQGHMSTVMWSHLVILCHSTVTYCLSWAVGVCTLSPIHSLVVTGSWTLIDLPDHQKRKRHFTLRILPAICQIHHSPHTLLALFFFPLH